LPSAHYTAEASDADCAGQHVFRYENVWQTHKDHDKIVSDMWNATTHEGGQQGLARALGKMQTGMSSWGKETFGNFKHRLTVLRKELERHRKRSVNAGPSHEEKKLMEKINEVLYQEEVWIRQRSRAMWLKAGDRNSAYFHAQAAQRKRRNKITVLQRSDGSWCEDAESVGKEIQDFYTGLYTTQGAPVMDGVLDLVPTKIDGEVRSKLEQDYCADEVKTALFQMHPSKAPGVDGFTAGFFQRHWDLVGNDIVAGVLEFLNGGELLQSLFFEKATSIT
jgi:hypothetical protein